MLQAVPLSTSSFAWTPTHCRWPSQRFASSPTLLAVSNVLSKSRPWFPHDGLLLKAAGLRSCMPAHLARHLPHTCMDADEDA